MWEAIVSRFIRFARWNKRRTISENDQLNGGVEIQSVQVKSAEQNCNIVEEKSVNTKKFCENFGEQLIDGAKFCLGCGVKLDEDAVFDNTVWYKICSFW